MVYRLIAPFWLLKEKPQTRKVLEGEFTEEQLKEYNTYGYNIYFLPNYPSIYNPGFLVDGSQIDTFRFVFVDCDLKDGIYTKESFIHRLQAFKLEPTYIVNSGRGIHAYWQVSDLNANSFLRLQRRLMRELKTDDAVAKIYQLMRVPGTINTKDKGNFHNCDYLLQTENVYTSEDLDKVLPIITSEDETYCEQHYSKTYQTNRNDIVVEDKIPLKFAKLIRENEEVRDIWSGLKNDRSAGDYRLGHIMFANGFTKEEATSVLVNSAKALARAPIHRISYAINIIDKIWIFDEAKDALLLSSSVKDILLRNGDTLKGTRFPCWGYLDATMHGFRLGQVIGLVAGSGVGKTAMALNMFMGFVQNNPDYDHMFVPLEQPANEIADRWKTMCGDKEHLHEKVHVISNYDESGAFRHLSLSEIRDYILRFQKTTNRKVGAVVIDHIGALKKKTKDGENQGLIDICHEMKAFAVETNTMLVMQSQAPREKAGIGDLELSKDAAYGTIFFESYCDFLITIWQPLKRTYKDGAPTVTAFKFCKIRHKKQGQDLLQEDTCYKLMFDPTNEQMRELTQDEEKSFTFFLSKATNARKADRKVDLVPYSSITWTGLNNGKINSNQDLRATKATSGISD